MSVFQRALALVGGTGERTGLRRCTLTDIMESQAAGRCVIWAQYFADDPSAFS